MHNAMSRDGWILPSKHSGICTTEWMLKVREDNIFCVHTNLENYKIRICFSPPPRNMLQEKIERAVIQLEAENQIPMNMVDKVHRLIGSLRLRPANVDWYISLLSYFNPTDEIFEKNYKYVREQNVQLEPAINNNDGLFNNLPLLTEQEVRKSNRMRLPKEMHLQ